MLRRMLFETAVGGWLLGLLERWAGLAIVDAQGLGAQVSGQPAALAAE